jgi:hypothetical protein
MDYNIKPSNISSALGGWCAQCALGEQIESSGSIVFPTGKSPLELSGTCLNNPSYQMLTY